jgi:DNA-binding NarL/FixJ family response regulator
MLEAERQFRRVLARVIHRRRRRRYSRSREGVAATVTTCVLVVEDDAIVRAWIRLALKGTEFSVAGEASTTATALELLNRRRVDLLLVDQRLPDRFGVELVRELRGRGDPRPAVLIAARAEPGLNEAARDAGAQGSVLKRGSVEELLTALRRVADGDQAFDPSHPKRPNDRGALSPREREVVRLLATGATNREIAASLHVGEETVKTLLSRTYTKLGVSRRAEAIAAAHEQAIL